MEVNGNENCKYLLQRNVKESHIENCYKKGTQRKGPKY